MTARIPDQPHDLDSCPETPTRCECGARLTYDQQCMDEPMCSDCMESDREAAAEARARRLEEE